MATARAVAGQESGARGVLKHLPDTFVGLGRTFEVLVSTDLLADLFTLLFLSLLDQLNHSRGQSNDITHLLRRDRLLAGLAELLNGLVVISQILLTTNQDDGKSLTEVKDLGDPLLGTCQ